MTGDAVDCTRLSANAMQITPLVNDGARIVWINDCIVRAVPH
jgi:hypothetical protein